MDVFNVREFSFVLYIGIFLLQLWNWQHCLCKLCGLHVLW